jgi:hypothetical protein
LEYLIANPRFQTARSKAPIPSAYRRCGRSDDRSRPRLAGIGRQSRTTLL